MRKRLIEVHRVTSSNNVKKFKLEGKRSDGTVRHLVSIGIISHRKIGIRVESNETTINQ